jgi:uncharacterized protein
MSSLVVACPTCKKKFKYHDSEYRPFCSEKCRLLDLGQWLSESYAVPAQKLTEEEIQNLEKIYEEKNHQDDEGSEDTAE